MYDVKRIDNKGADFKQKEIFKFKGMESILIWQQDRK
jgi:hypothetical protein